MPSFCPRRRAGTASGLPTGRPFSIVEVASTTATIERFEVLGLHPLRPDRTDAFDGFDLALGLSTGEVCVYGVRTGGLVLDGHPNDRRGWLDGYPPVRVEF